MFRDPHLTSKEEEEEEENNNKENKRGIVKDTVSH
jgi:hypothetical protein